MIASGRRSAVDGAARSAARDSLNGRSKAMPHPTESSAQKSLAERFSSTIGITGRRSKIWRWPLRSLRRSRGCLSSGCFCLERPSAGGHAGFYTISIADRRGPRNIRRGNLQGSCSHSLIREVGKAVISRACLFVARSMPESLCLPVRRLGRQHRILMPTPVFSTPIVQCLRRPRAVNVLFVDGPSVS
jgi:hypothetical protein